MTAFTALLPTHAMFAEAASAPSENFASSRLCVSNSAPIDPIRKYVILRDGVTGAEHTLVFSKDIQHSTVVPPGLTPVSAGFLILLPSGVQILEKFPSESLNLYPRPQDSDIIKNFLN